MNFFKRLVDRLRKALFDLSNMRNMMGELRANQQKLQADLNNQIEQVKFNQGVILSALNEKKSSKNLKDHEFKVFSQWGDDGIIQYLTKAIEIKNKTFIEFGIEDFSESNCRFLLMKDNWKGFVIDGSKDNIDKVKNSYYYWKHHLTAVDGFITKENINELLATSGFEEDLGLLSIDIDGNDYYVLQAIENFKPRILICEYNALFGDKRKISTPYKADFQRTHGHYSNLYWGASLAAMTLNAKEKGYELVGTNSAGNNAFYIRRDLLNEKVRVLDVEQAFTPSHFRETRDQQGVLTYATGEKRNEIIKDLKVFEVEKRVEEQF